jgi:hypothetical protein
MTLNEHDTGLPVKGETEEELKRRTAERKRERGII